MPFRVKRGARFWCCQAPVFSSVRGVPRVRTGPTGSRQAAAATGARPPWATVTQPRGDAPRRGYGAPPPVDSRRLVPDRPWRRGAFPPLIIVRRASTRLTSFVLAALRALHVDRAFTAGALLRYRGNAEMCWDA